MQGQAVVLVDSFYCSLISTTESSGWRSERFRNAIFLGFFPTKKLENEKVSYVALLILPSGEIAQTAGPIEASQPPEISIKLLNSVGLIPHINVDPLIEECFSVGYKEVNFGPNSYANSAFGISCKFERGKEPRTPAGWPLVWDLVKKYEVAGGAGGHHSHQMARFVASGVHKFGRILR